MKARQVFSVEIEIYVKASSRQGAVEAVTSMMRTFETNHDSVPRVAVGGARETDPLEYEDEGAS